MFFRSYTSALFERTPEEIRLALDVYQQELNRLMQGQQTAAAAVTTTITNASSSNVQVGGGNAPPPLSNGFPQDLSIPKSQSGGARSDDEDCDPPPRDVKNSKSIIKSMAENGGGVAESLTHSKKRSASPAVVQVKTENSPNIFMASHSLHNILRPSSSPSPGVESSNSTAGGGSAASTAAAAVAAAAAANNGGVASPLQRIASITNSLMSQPSNPTLPQVTQRPMKAILPPITQQQFDTYQNLNTEDIVKKVGKTFALFFLRVNFWWSACKETMAMLNIIGHANFELGGSMGFRKRTPSDWRQFQWICLLSGRWLIEIPGRFE